MLRLCLNPKTTRHKNISISSCLCNSYTQYSLNAAHLHFFYFSINKIFRMLYIFFVLLNPYGYLYRLIENRKFLFLILASKNRCNELIKLFNLPYSFIESFLKTFVVLESFLVVFYPDIRLY